MLHVSWLNAFLKNFHSSFRVLVNIAESAPHDGLKEDESFAIKPSIFVFSIEKRLMISWEVTVGERFAFANHSLHELSRTVLLIEMRYHFK